MSGFVVGAIPAALRERERWVLWLLDGSGKKTPRKASRPDRPCDATKPATWTTFASATDAATRHSQGIGFALGAVEDGPTFAGVDFDKCRNPETGVLEPWAENLVRFLDSYTEVSPSGTGVKVFVPSIAITVRC